jgi:hypothetical protein
VYITQKESAMNLNAAQLLGILIAVGTVIKEKLDEE